MNVVHLQKTFAFIASGLVEKEMLLKESPNRYPYSKNLQRGINMFCLLRCSTKIYVDYTFDRV